MNRILSKKDGILAIQEAIMKNFPNFSIVDEVVDNQPNNSFILKYNYDGFEIKFLNDRGYLEVILETGDQVESLDDIEPAVIEAMLNEDGIIRVISALKSIF